MLLLVHSSPTSHYRRYRWRRYNIEHCMVKSTKARTTPDKLTIMDDTTNHTAIPANLRADDRLMSA